MKVRGVTFHSLRHGFAKTMADRLVTEQLCKRRGIFLSKCWNIMQTIGRRKMSQLGT
jgi:integrase